MEGELTCSEYCYVLGDFFLIHLSSNLGFPYSSVGKESACSAGDLGLIPGLEKSPGDGNGNPLQYSCLENLTDRGAWQATVHGVARVRHNLVTKPPKEERNASSSLKISEYIFALYMQDMIMGGIGNGIRFLAFIGNNKYSEQEESVGSL